MDFIFVFILNIVKILKYAILIRVLLSWIRPAHPGQFSRILYQVTEPILMIFRGILPRGSMIDFSPLLAFFALDFAQLGIMKLAERLAG